MGKIVLIILLLCSIHFWGYLAFTQIFHNITNAISLVIMGISFFRTINKNGLKFKSAITLFIIGIGINIISAYINQGQAILNTFISFGPFYFILFYFFLHDKQPNRKFLENIIIVFAILYSLFYIVQYFSYPIEIFNTSMLVDRGTIRLRIEGNGFLVLAYFLFLNRYFLNRQFKNIFFAFGFFIILVMGGFRTLSIFAFIISGLMFIKLTKYSTSNVTILLFFFLFLGGLLQIPITSKILNEMLDASIEENDEGSDYIRFVELNYFFTKYPTNKSYFIFGGGLPGNESDYANSMSVRQDNEGLYWDDLGLIGFYIVIGAIALLGLIWYSVKAIITKLHPSNIYIAMYFLYLLVVSFTTMEIFRTGIFAVEAIGLYLIDISSYSKNKILYK